METRDNLRAVVPPLDFRVRPPGVPSSRARLKVLLGALIRAGWHVPTEPMKPRAACATSAS